MPEGILNDASRRTIAAAITKHHCDETGAPPSYVPPTELGHRVAERSSWLLSILMAQTRTCIIFY